MLRNVLIVTVVLISLDVHAFNTYPEGERVYLVKNAVWMFPEQITTNFMELRDMARKIESMGLLRVFLMAGRVKKSGTLVPIKPENVRRFRQVLLNWNGDMNAVPWIGWRTAYLPLEDLGKEEVFNRFLSSLKGILKISGGDEVHLDIEPLRERGDTLEILNKLKRSLVGWRLSLAVPGPPPKGVDIREGLYFLSDVFLKKLCSLADELVVMFYDTGLYREKDYEDYVKDVLLTLTVEGGARGCKVVAGIPAYYSPSRKHNPAVENVENALSAIRRALHDPRFYFPAFGGIAVYRYALIDGREEKAIKEFTFSFTKGR